MHVQPRFIAPGPTGATPTGPCSGLSPRARQTVNDTRLWTPYRTSTRKGFGNARNRIKPCVPAPRLSSPHPPTYAANQIRYVALRSHSLCSRHCPATPRTAGAVSSTTPNGRSPPVLHRKELLLPANHPLVPAGVELTERLDRLGAFEDATRIGTREAWRARLSSLGLTIEDGELVPTP